MRSDAFQTDLGALTGRYPALKPLEGALTEACDLLVSSIESGNKILTCGNGGSAADAEHIVGELVKSFAFNRPIGPTEEALIREMYPEHGAELVSNLEEGFPAFSLVGQTSLITAFANDIGYDYAFAQQVYTLGREGDVLIAISTSGASKSVVNAARIAKMRGVKVLGLMGSNRGELSALSDVALCVPSTETHVIQEHHLPIYHFLCFAMERHFFEDFGLKKTNEQGPARPVVAPEGSSRQPQLPQDIELLVFDFDGVFTDNRVLTNQEGLEAVICDRADGLGIDRLRRAAIPLLIVSTERNPVVRARAEKLKIPSEFGCVDKRAFLIAYLEEHDLSPSKTVYVGNDVNDSEAMDLAGFVVVPKDAHPSVRKKADLVLTKNGGRGAVRELADMICDRRDVS